MSWIGVDGKARSATVRFRDASARGVAVQLPEQIELGRTVWLLLKDGADYRGVTSNCRPSGQEFVIGIQIVPEKPATASVASGTSGCHMKWLDASGQLRCSPVSIRRRGATHLEVVAEEAVPAPAVALLIAEGELCLGAVSDSAPIGDRFQLQVDLISDTYFTPGAKAQK